MKWKFQWTERRKNHIDMIRDDHPLVPIANHCLHYQERSRPSSEELCQRLAALKESKEYQESMQNYSDEIETKSYQILSQTRQLEEKDRLLQQKDDEIALQNQELQVKDKIVLNKDVQLQWYASREAASLTTWRTRASYYRDPADTTNTGGTTTTKKLLYKRNSLEKRISYLNKRQMSSKLRAKIFKIILKVIKLNSTKRRIVIFKKI